MPWCAGASRAGAYEQHAVGRPQSDRRPDLGAVDDEVVAVELGPTAQAGEIAPRVGLAEPLAPDLFGGEDPREVFALLGGARGGDGGADVLDPEHRDATRRPGPAELGVARDLVLDAQTMATDLDRPRRRAPPPCPELTLELDETVPLVGVTPALAMTGHEIGEHGTEFFVRAHRRDTTHRP